MVTLQTFAACLLAAALLTTRGQNQNPPATAPGALTPPAVAAAPDTNPPVIAPASLETPPAPIIKEPAPAKPKPKKPAVIVIRGKLSAVDKTAMTITVTGKKPHTFHITSRTRFLKEGKPATFSDAAVGEDVSVSPKAAKGGQLEAVTVRYGVKASSAAAPHDVKKAAGGKAEGEKPPGTAQPK